MFHKRHALRAWNHVWTLVSVVVPSSSNYGSVELLWRRCLGSGICIPSHAMVAQCLTSGTHLQVFLSFSDSNWPNWSKLFFFLCLGNTSSSWWPMKPISCWTSKNSMFGAQRLRLVVRVPATASDSQRSTVLRSNRFSTTMTRRIRTVPQIPRCTWDIKKQCKTSDTVWRIWDQLESKEKRK